MSRVSATRTLENALRRMGFAMVAGVDEVGRGCLAGPVTAAAVILDPQRHIAGLADSKAVPAEERAELYDAIVRHAISWAVASSDPSEIDRLNIHRASLDAMRFAFRRLREERVAVLLATRVDDPAVFGEREFSGIALTGIDAAATGALFAERVGGTSTVGWRSESS